jgi:hypothetical protein
MEWVQLQQITTFIFHQLPIFLHFHELPSRQCQVLSRYWDHEARLLIWGSKFHKGSQGIQKSWQFEIFGQAFREKIWAGQQRCADVERCFGASSQIVLMVLSCCVVFLFLKKRMKCCEQKNK